MLWRRATQAPSRFERPTKPVAPLTRSRTPCCRYAKRKRLVYELNERFETACNGSMRFVIWRDSWPIDKREMVVCVAVARRRPIAVGHRIQPIADTRPEPRRRYFTRDLGTLRCAKNSVEDDDFFAMRVRDFVPRTPQKVGSQSLEWWMGGVGGWVGNVCVCVRLSRGGAEQATCTSSLTPIFVDQH